VSEHRPILVDNPEEEARPEMPLPSDAKTIFLGGLFFLAAFVTFYFAREIVLPIILAVILKLVLNPVVRGLHRLYVPRAIGALLAIAVLFGAIFGLVAILSGPAAGWAQKLPSGIPRLEQHLSFLTGSVNAAKKVLQKAEEATDNTDEAKGPIVTVKQPSIVDTLMENTRIALAGVFTTMLLLFFLIVSGDTFLRRIVEILPRFSDKRQAVEIAQQTEHDMSIYLGTITLMNGLVGVVTGLAMWACGLGDPLLWGTAAFLLNYVMILGPFVGVVMFVFVGMLSFDDLGWSLLPAALYLSIHMVEGEFITPMLLAKRFTLNPVLVILSLLFWYWMWGVPGAILSVPILAITKIVCDRVRPLAAFGHFLEG
jgi:predicted PurR-regulated permease PerM